MAPRVLRATRPDPITRITLLGLPLYFAAAGLSISQIVSGHSALVMALALAGIAAFTGSFLMVALRPPAPDNRMLALLAVSVGLAIALAPLGGPSIMYLITIGALGATILNLPGALVLISALTAAIAVTDASSGSKTQQVFTDASITVVLGLFTFGITHLSQTNRELAAARQEVARLAVADERLRFARDLHDLLGHSLTVIRAKAELASRLSDPGSRAGAEMEEVEGLARRALTEVRQAVSGYRQPLLSAELTNASAALAAAGIRAVLPEGEREFPPAVDAALGWVVREAVANVLRHSRARSCRIGSFVQHGSVVLEVIDDGVGPADMNGSGHGLAGLRERLAPIGGTLETSADARGGFRLVARVPITS